MIAGYGNRLPPSLVTSPVPRHRPAFARSSNHAALRRVSAVVELALIGQSRCAPGVVTLPLVSKNRLEALARASMSYSA